MYVSDYGENELCLDMFDKWRIGIACANATSAEDMTSKGAWSSGAQNEA